MIKSNRSLISCLSFISYSSKLRSFYTTPHWAEISHSLLKYQKIKDFGRYYKLLGQITSSMPRTWIQRWQSTCVLNLLSILQTPPSRVFKGLAGLSLPPLSMDSKSNTEWSWKWWTVVLSPPSNNSLPPSCLLHMEISKESRNIVPRKEVLELLTSFLTML